MAYTQEEIDTLNIAPRYNFATGEYEAVQAGEDLNYSYNQQAGYEGTDFGSEEYYAEGGLGYVPPESGTGTAAQTTEPNTFIDARGRVIGYVDGVQTVLDASNDTLAGASELTNELIPEGTIGTFVDSRGRVVGYNSSNEQYVIDDSKDTLVSANTELAPNTFIDPRGRVIEFDENGVQTVLSNANDNYYTSKPQAEWTDQDITAFTTDRFNLFTSDRAGFDTWASENPTWAARFFAETAAAGQQTDGFNASMGSLSTGLPFNINLADLLPEGAESDPYSSMGTTEQRLDFAKQFAPQGTPRYYGSSEFDDVNSSGSVGDFFKIGESGSTGSNGIVSFAQNNPFETAAIITALAAAPTAINALTPSLGSTGAAAVVGGGQSVVNQFAATGGLDLTTLATAVGTSGVQGFAGDLFGQLGGSALDSVGAAEDTYSWVDTAASVGSGIVDTGWTLNDAADANSMTQTPQGTTDQEVWDINHPDPSATIPKWDILWGLEGMGIPIPGLPFPIPATINPEALLKILKDPVGWIDGMVDAAGNIIGDITDWVTGGPETSEVDPETGVVTTTNSDTGDVTVTNPNNGETTTTSTNPDTGETTTTSGETPGDTTTGGEQTTGGEEDDGWWGSDFLDWIMGNDGDLNEDDTNGDGTISAGEAAAAAAAAAAIIIGGGGGNDNTHDNDPNTTPPVVPGDVDPNNTPPTPPFDPGEDPNNTPPTPPFDPGEDPNNTPPTPPLDGEPPLPPELEPPPTPPLDGEPPTPPLDGEPPPTPPLDGEPPPVPPTPPFDPEDEDGDDETEYEFDNSGLSERFARENPLTGQERRQKLNYNNIMMRVDNHEMGRQAMNEKLVGDSKSGKFSAGYGSNASMAALHEVNQHSGNVTGTSQATLMSSLNQLQMDRDFEVFDVINANTRQLGQRLNGMNTASIEAERAYAQAKKDRDYERNHDIAEIGLFGAAMYGDYRKDKKAEE